MSTKTFKVRALLLCKLASEWADHKFDVFENGEVCIIREDPVEGATTPQLVFMKIGDGKSQFKDLPTMQAVAGDVWEWAKQEHLQWADMDAESFINPLDQHIKDSFEHADTKYQLVEDGLYKWKLQKNEGEGWVDATGYIDASELNNRITNLEATRVEKSKTTDQGTSEVVNDGIRAELKFSNIDLTQSTVDAKSEKVEIAVENAVASKSAKFLVTKDGIYYLLDKQGTAVADDEIVVKRDIKDLEGGVHFIGVSTTDPNTGVVTIDGEVYSNPKPGDIVFYGKKEFIYGKNGQWRGFGDESIYETKAEADARYAELKDAIEKEIEDRAAADTALSDDLNAKINTQASLLEDEVENRTNADTLIVNDLASEVVAREEEHTQTISYVDAKILEVQGMVKFVNLVQDPEDVIILNCND